MNADSTDDKSPVTGSGARTFSPAIFIRSPRSGGLDREWLAELRQHFPKSAIFARPRLIGDHDIQPFDGPTDSVRSIAAALDEQDGVDGLLVIRHGLVVPFGFAQRLARMTQRPGLPELTLFAGNHEAHCNPLAEIEIGIEPEAVDSLVFNCAERRWTAVADGEWECAFLSTARQRSAAGGRGAATALVDEFYLVDPTRPLQAGKPPIAAERAALGHLRSALVELEGEGIRSLPYPGLDDKPVVLHVTHSWGGGIARWIDDQCRHDDQAHHLVLASGGHRDGLEHGQELSLFLAGTESGKAQHLVLTPPISDSTASHSGYREFFNWLLDRYQVNRVVVSSLIGHSLECLKSGLPTLQVLHDFYPASPVLDVDPLNYLDSGGRFQMKQLLGDNRDNLRFLEHDAGYWRDLRERWLQVVREHDVVLLAPSQHVAMRWQRLFREELADIEVIPHGFRPAWEGSVRIEPRPRRDGRLNLVMVGRLSPGKGLGLLTSSLDGVTEHAHLTLVGAGKRAEDLFGKAGVDVVLDYREQDLPELLTQIGPEAALFLSTVPETWSYVLSEIRSLGIVPIATRTGSFVERIDDGVDGVLLDPEPRAVITTLARLAADRAELERLAAKRVSEPDLETITGRYRQLLALQQPRQSGVFPDRELSPQRYWLMAESAALRLKLERADDRLDEQSEELARRADWALRQQRLVSERTDWARHLESEVRESLDARGQLQQQLDHLEKDLAERARWGRELEETLAERTAWARSVDRDLAEVRQTLEESQERYRNLEQELDERTAWARNLEQDLEHVRLVRDELSVALQEMEQDLIQTRQHYHQAQLERDRLERVNLQQQTELASLESTRIRLEHHLAVVLSSKSWRLTRPIRFITRLLRKLLNHHAWNPLAWPKLFARLVQGIRAHGWRRTFARLHHQPLPGIEDLPEPSRPIDQPVGDMAHSSTTVDDLVSAPNGEEQPECLDGIEFKDSRKPVASIVIPVYNKVQLTRACLESIARTPSNIEYEIIVVDDCSSDHTSEFLADCSGIVALRNEVNSGFIDTCNRGAEQARGEFVVFLNNDTTVTPGWLDALIDTFHADPEVGVVGAKLVYPDGRLQEAGGIIFNDASGWNYGRNDDPDQPQYAFVSEADYVSGACLAVRRDDFAELGGFDTRFRPAYYEDTDLCFQVRASGKKVVVQPAATIVHHEGATSGTDESGGVKRYQAVNRDKFRAKWADTLAGHPPPEPDFERQDPIRHARYRRYRRRMLLIDAVTPQPDHDSGSVRIVAMMTLLKEMGYQVSLMPENRQWVDRYSEDLQQAGIEVLCAPQVANLEPWLDEHGADLDLVVVSRHYVLAPMLDMVRHHCPQALLVFDTVDLHFLREEREAEVTGSAAMVEQARATRSQELDLIRDSDVTLVVSPVEQELLTGLLPDADVRIVSNIHDVHGSARDWEDRSGLMFVGGFQHLPNVDAARWLVDEIFPLVRNEIPDVELHLIGSRMPTEIRSIDVPGVQVHGFVEDLNPFLDGCRVSVAPLRYGAGVKGKVNQAMSHGLPVVATTCAAEGMFLEHGKDVLVCDDVAAFAREVVRAHQDRELWEGLSSGGLSNVEHHFSRAAARRALEEIDHLVSAQRRH